MPSRLSYPMFSISYEREDIPVQTISPSKIPDESWRYIDKAGHGHFWKGRELPTLEWVVTGKEWIGDEYDGEAYDVGEYRCLICAEVIEPKRKLEYGPPSIPGPARYTVTIDDESFTLNEEAWADALDYLRRFLRNKFPSEVLSTWKGR